MIETILHSYLLKAETFFKIFAIVIILTVLVAWCKLVLRRRRISKSIPGFKFRPLNVLGDISNIPFTASKRNGYPFTAILSQVISGNMHLYRKDVSSCWVGNQLLVCFASANTVEEFLGCSKNTEKAFIYKYIGLFLRDGLVNSKGEKWKSRRKLLNSAFHFEILKEYLYTINEHSLTLVRKLQKECTKDSTEIMTTLSDCTLDIVSSTTMGVKVGLLENNNSEFSKASIRCVELIMKRLTLCFLPDFLFNLTNYGIELNKNLKIAHNFTKKILQERKHKVLSGEIDVTRNKRKCVLDILLEQHINNPKYFTEEDIQEEIDTFIAAGNETSAITITMTMYLLGLYKDVQAKLHEEMDWIFGEDIDREVTNDDINKMNYLDCVIKEAQRLYPPVPLLLRNITEDISVCGFPIPKGTVGMVCVYDLHRDPEVFPVPEKFDPDRFLPENSRNRNPYAFIPFSAGARSCIGQRFAQMELKVILSHILRNYTVESLLERDKIVPKINISLGTVKPIQIRIRQRTRT